MVFMSSELGEHSITTRDTDVNENTVVQFEVGLCAIDVGIFLTVSCGKERHCLLCDSCSRLMWAAQLKALP